MARDLFQEAGISPQGRDLFQEAGIDAPPPSDKKKRSIADAAIDTALNFDGGLFGGVLQMAGGAAERAYQASNQTPAEFLRSAAKSGLNALALTNPIAREAINRALPDAQQKIPQTPEEVKQALDAKRDHDTSTLGAVANIWRDKGQEVSKAFKAKQSEAGREQDAGLAQAQQDGAISALKYLKDNPGALLNLMANSAGYSVPIMAASRFGGEQAGLVLNAGMSGLAGGASASDQTKEELLALPESTWQQSKPYQQLRKAGMDHTEAATYLADKAAAQAFDQSAAVSAAAGAITAPLEVKMLRGGIASKAGIINEAKALGKTIAKEGGEEYLQEGWGEQLAQEMAQRDAGINKSNADILQSVNTAGVLGAVGGIAQGGGVHAVGRAVNIADGNPNIGHAPGEKSPPGAQPGAQPAPAATPVTEAATQSDAPAAPQKTRIMAGPDGKAMVVPVADPQQAAPTQDFQADANTGAASILDQLEQQQAAKEASAAPVAPVAAPESEVATAAAPNISEPAPNVSAAAPVVSESAPNVADEAPSIAPPSSNATAGFKPGSIAAQPNASADLPAMLKIADDVESKLTGGEDVDPAVISRLADVATSHAEYFPALAGAVQANVAKVAGIDAHIQQLTAEAETRSAPVQASLGRQVAKLQQQKAAITGEPVQESAPAAPIAPKATPAETTAPKSKLTPLQDERISKHAQELQALANEAGWAEQGGRMIRDPSTGDVTARTKWIPNADWWAGIDANSRLDQTASIKAVNKAIAGEPLTAKEKRAVNAMLDVADYHEQLRNGGGEQDVAIDHAAQDDEAIAEREAIQAEAAGDLAALNDDEFFALEDALFNGEGSTLSDDEIRQWLGEEPETKGSGVAAETRPGNTAGAGNAGGSETRPASAEKPAAKRKNAAGDAAGNQGNEQKSVAPDFALNGQTEAEIAEQEAARKAQEAEADKARKQEEKQRSDEATRKEIKARSVAAADTFTLGGNAEDNLTGQGGLFDATAETAWKPNNESSSEGARQGQVGGKLSHGEVVLTASGRKTTPFPKFMSKNGNLKRSVDKDISEWLLQNAADEARARGDRFNERPFQQAADNPKNISQADKDSAEEYLFGNQPGVVPSILKPLSESSIEQTQARSPEKVPDLAPNGASNDEMAALKAEMGDAIGELAALLGVRKNLTAEEESKIIPVMSKIFRIAAKMGYVSFKDAARHVMIQIRQIGGDELANKLSIDNLQAGYINIAKEIGGDKREALAYDSIQELEGEPQPSANAPQSDSAQSATDNAAPSLVDKFAGEIANGNMPKDNNALRKMVAAMDGKQPDAFRMKQAQEDLEAAIVVAARSQVDKGQDTKDTFNRLVDLYQSQPNLNIRTSSSIANQAYSTPAPLAYAAAKLAGINESTHVFEPTAGNGMLLLTASPNNATANELDERRFANLQAQGFDAIHGNALDAVTSGAVVEKSQDAVITNPPFGSVKDDAGKATKVVVDGYKIGKIDHLIAAGALRTLRDDGKAVLIIGADKVAGGLSTDDRIFFNWLYSHYNVTHHFEVDGSLYARQGASWPVRVIALNGRVESNGISPKAGTVERVNTWEQVYGQLEQGLVSQDRSIDRNAASSTDGSVSGATATNEQVNSPVAAGGKTQPRSNGGRARGTVGANDVGGQRTGTGRNPEQLPAERMGAADSTKRRDEPASGQTGLESGNPERVQAAATSGNNQPSGNAGTNRVAAQDEAGNTFQAKYVPASARKDDGVLIPVNMAQPLSDALATMEDEVGDIDQFTAKELGYRSVDELHQALMGLQVDSVATSIRNLKNGNGTIIADQTGIGKGRQAAAIIRWAAKNNRIPVFVTVKPALFTDMYNDLADIGSHDIAPFILNVDESISGASGNKLFANKKATHKRALTDIANSGTLPDGSNAVFMTYSQINTANIQRSAIATIAPRAIFVLDESHNAGGESATGEYIKGLLDNAPGVVYLSATYAKRPDNMPLYFRTDIGKAIADDSALKDAMANGGLPLQTVVSNNLVKAGQMFRRERSYDGISISTVVDTGNTAKHVDLADKVTSALRAIVQADKAFHDNYFESVKKELEKEGKGAYDIAGNQAGKSVDHSEFSSVVHNFVRQLLLGLKADAAADHAIAALKRGEKPLIALENTMGSFLSEYAAGSGIQVGQPLGDFDYRTVLSRALKRSRYIQVDDGAGNKSKQYIGLDKLDPVTRQEYDNAQEVIDSLQVAEIPVSPLDWIRHRLQKAGYSVAEITGRDLAVDYSKATPVLANVPSEEQSDKVLTTRRFNGGKLDAIILNVSGSTGISLHASEKFSDQRPRHMIVAQPAQDINIFMQMLGRIHRTGQVVLPTYTILNVDLPAEKRPTALLSKKMKSLNANTSSNTESATSVQSVDILNKYGDQVVADYLQENIDLAHAMNIEVSADAVEDLARKVTGRLALMPVETQQRFYSEIEAQYQSLIDYLNKTNQNDLEPRTFDFDAKETRRETLVKASGDSPFEQAADYIEFSIKAQGKAMTPDEIKVEISDNLQGKHPSEHASDMVAQLNDKYQSFISEQQSDLAKENAAGTKMAGERFILQHPIGSTWRVEINDDHYNAVIINIKNSHKSAGNPFSLSKTTVTIAVNGSLRQVSVPATQFEKITTSQIYSYGPYQASVDRYFSSSVADERETAKMITGNLLAAYGELSGVHGTIVNFSRDDGRVDQGILLPKRFDFKQNTSGDYRFKSASDIYKFLRESNSKGVDKIGVQNREQTVRVTLDSNGIAISVPKSKAKGWKYFGDTALTKITGDFVTAGGMMNAYVDKQNAESAINALTKKTALYAIPSMAEEARKIVGDEMPVNSNRYSLPGQSAKPELNSVASLRAALDANELGPIISKLIDSGRIVLHDIQSTFNPSLKFKVNGVTTADGKVHLIAENLSKKNAMAVLLHELFHLNGKNLIGTPNWTKLMQSLEQAMIMAKNTNGRLGDFYREAERRLEIAKRAGPVGIQAEEFGAYLIEDFEQAPNSLRKLAEKIVGEIKAWLLRHFETQVGRVTPGQLRAIARAALIDASEHAGDNARVVNGRLAYSRDGKHSVVDMAQTITVDGIERPTTNSNGQPIHPTEEGVRNFWRWFADSKVVDKDGKPLVVYHGSPSNGIEFFDATREGKNTGAADDNHALGGFYFTADPNTADTYARTFEVDMANTAEQEFGIKPAATLPTPTTYPVYLSIQNPAELRMPVQRQVLGMAKDSGKDGALLRAGGNIEYVAFKPEQIKSAIGNNGEFSADNQDIRYSISDDATQKVKDQIDKLTSRESIDKVLYNLQDKFIDLKRLREHMQKAGNLAEKIDGYLAETLFHGRVAKRHKDFLEKEIKPLMAGIRAAGVSMEQFEQFLHARHAPERNAEMAKRNPSQTEVDTGIKAATAKVRELEAKLSKASKAGTATTSIEQALNEARADLYGWASAQPFKGTEAERLSLSGMSDEEAADIVASYPPAKRKALEELGAKVDQINDGTLKALEQYGLETKPMLDTWRSAYSHYVPLHRDEAHPNNSFHPIGQGFSVKGHASKRATGSNAKVTDILGHLAMQREAAITRGEKNLVAQTLFMQVKALDDAGFASVEAVPRRKVIDKATGFVRSEIDPNYRNMPNVLMLKAAGRDAAIVFNEHNQEAMRLAGALKNMDATDMGFIASKIAPITRWFAAVNTQYNPIFGIVNLIRDSGSGVANLTSTELNGQQRAVSRAAASILREVWANAGRLPKGGDVAALWDDYQNVGGQTGYRESFRDAASRAKELRKELQSLDRSKKSQAFHAVADWLSDFNEAMENSIRLAAYKVGLDNGMSKQKAAELAKNLTVNFNRKGAMGRDAGAYYAFFNASVQGTARMMETLRGPAGKAIIKGGLAIGAAQAMIGAMMMGGAGGDDDSWAKIPEFVKERNLIIPISHDDYFTIPLPMGLHIIPNMGRLAVESLLGYVTPTRAAGNMISVVVDSFNPVGSSTLLQTLSPTALDPIVALSENKDWTGKQIYRENMNSLDPEPGHRRTKDSASSVSKMASRAVNWATGGTEYQPGAWSPTPDQIDYVLGQITGGVGREALKLNQTITAPFTGDELPPNKIPLVGRFYGNTRNVQANSEQYYENVTKLNQVENELKGRYKDNADAGAFRDSEPLTNLIGAGNYAENQIRHLRQQRRELVKREPDGWKDSVKDVDARIAVVMSGLNKQIRESK